MWPARTLKNWGSVGARAHEAAERRAAVIVARAQPAGLRFRIDPHATERAFRTVAAEPVRFGDKDRAGAGSFTATAGRASAAKVGSPQQGEVIPRLPGRASRGAFCRTNGAVDFKRRGLMPVNPAGRARVGLRRASASATIDAGRFAGRRQGNRRGRLVLGDDLGDLADGAGRGTFGSRRPGWS